MIAHAGIVAFDGAIVAYEPVWAIGTGKVASAADAQEVCHGIRELVRELADDTVADEIRILYGGSVNPENCEELIACPHIDGLFIGRSAWKVEGYLDILARCAATIGDDA